MTIHSDVEMHVEPNCADRPLGMVVEVPMKGHSPLTNPHVAELEEIIGAEEENSLVEEENLETLVEAEESAGETEESDEDAEVEAEVEEDVETGEDIEIDEDVEIEEDLGTALGNSVTCEDGSCSPTAVSDADATAFGITCHHHSLPGMTEPLLENIAYAISEEETAGQFNSAHTPHMEEDVDMSDKEQYTRKR